MAGTGLEHLSAAADISQKSYQLSISSLMNSLAIQNCISNWVNLLCFSGKSNIILLSTSIFPTEHPAKRPKGVHHDDILAIYRSKVNSKADFFSLKESGLEISHLLSSFTSSGDARFNASLLLYFCK